MSTMNLGKVRIDPKNTWSSASSYEFLNTVYDTGTGSSYMAVQNVPTGTAITNADYWMMLCKGFSETDVSNAVSAWLVAHPEATTTVQDGAVTLAKLASDIHDNVNDIPNIKGVAEGAYDISLNNLGVSEVVVGRVENGSATNSGNLNAVHTDYIPVNGGEIVSITVNRAVSQIGAYYAFACTLYTSAKSVIYTYDWSAVENINQTVITTTATKYIRYTIACYDSNNQPIPLRKGDFVYGDAVVTVNSLNAVTDKLSVMDNEMLHNMHVRFQGGYWQADGSYAEGGNSSECMLPYIERNADFIKCVGANYFVVFLYSGNTYLGKINENFAIDKVAGGAHFSKFTGTINISAIMKHFNADGFTVTVNHGTQEKTSYYYTHSEELCQFYSYEDQTEQYIEKIPMTRGTWSGSNLETFYCNRTQTRMRPYFLIPVKVGDMIYFDCDNGKYIHALGYWANGLPGIGSKKWDDGTSRAGNEYVRFAFDGYVMASFSLASDTSAIIDPDTFTGSMTLIRNSQRHDMQNLNDQALRDAMGAHRNFSNTAANNTPYNNLPTFVHVTDVHGDAPSFGNAYDVAKLLKADAFVATGDMVYYYATDPVDYIADTVSDKKVDFLMCMGNHDGFLLDREGQYEKYIEPFATTYGYHLDDAEGVTYPTYYYKDYSNKSLRVIVVNQFEYDGKESSTDTRPCYTQAQMDFIVDALATTPANYGVIIAMHSPEKTPSKDSTYDKFFQRKFLYTGYGTSIHPLADIVDAFISKTTLSQTYNNPSGATPSSVTVTADFSSVNSGVEFIAYICGHYHSDAVSYVSSTTNKQLLLNATTTNSWTNMKKAGVGSNTLYSDNPYLAELCDLQRMSGTPSQDAFNVYVIDRENKAVKVIRVGSNRTDTMDIRDYMVIPYAD